MKKATSILILFAALIFLAQTVTAKTFYLKNGEEIDYQKSWKKNGRIYVLVNRDTLIDFAPGEVDLKRTYRKPAAEKKAKHHLVKKHHKVLKGHKKAKKPTVSGKSMQVGNAPESKVTKKGTPPQPATKALSGAQKKTSVPPAVKQGKPATPPAQPPKSPVRNSPAGK